MIGVILSTGKATLHELDTVYSLQDAYDLLEVIMVDAHNNRAVNKHFEAKARNANHN